LGGIRSSDLRRRAFLASPAKAGDGRNYELHVPHERVRGLADGHDVLGQLAVDLREYPLLWPQGIAKECTSRWKPSWARTGLCSLVVTRRFQNNLHTMCSVVSEEVNEK
jgi:hypothetical protein